MMVNPAIFKELSTSELFAGVCAFVTNEGFSDQDVIAFFAALEAENPDAEGMFDISETDTGLKSERLVRLLNFFQMGKIIMIPPPNPVPQRFVVPDQSKASLKATLERRGHLAKYESSFEALAQKLLDQARGRAR